ncbi:MAG: hypothetical protein OXR64_09900 [Chloroflexota bacterium]|nr:hypothetical protein [Chloroflexota bacterium]MDE2920145.1 hypothetical protein [Chloroflexota bacterium]
MVRQTRLLIRPDEIAAIRVTCRHCDNAVLLRLATAETLPDDCPMCGQSQWLVDTHAHRLVTVLRQIQRHPDSTTTAHLHLEVDDQEPAKEATP